MQAGVFLQQLPAKYRYVLLFILGLSFYLAFSWLLPVTDPVESNYALTAKEMALSGDWLSPQIYGKAWFDKPIMTYWLTAFAFKVFGFTEVAARLVPAVFASLGLLLLYWFMEQTGRKDAALSAVLILGTSLEYFVLGKGIVTDMIFFVFHNAALVCFYLGYVRRPQTRRWYMAMYAMLGLAVLTKGPAGLVLPLLIMVSFIFLDKQGDGRVQELQKLVSLPCVGVFLLTALPWYGAMYAVHGTKFIMVFLGVHNYLRATVSEHPDDNVIYYYLVVFLLGMLPWSLIAVKALWSAVKAGRMREDSLSLLALLWAGVYLVFYSLMATKYITYIFPLLFPVALLTAAYWAGEDAAPSRRWLIGGSMLPLALLCLGATGLAGRYAEGMTLYAVYGGIALCLAGLAGAAGWLPGRSLLSATAAVQIVLLLLLSATVFPQLTELRSGRWMAEDIARSSVRQAAFYGTYSTSFVFYSGITAVSRSQGITPGDVLGMNWQQKYTMPRQSLEEFLAGSQEGERVVVVRDNQRDEFERDPLRQNLTIRREQNGFTMYQ